MIWESSTFTKRSIFCDLFRYGKEFHVNLLQEKRRSRWILFYLRSYTVDLNMWRLGGKEYERILNSGWPFLKIKVKRKIYLCFKEKCDHMRCFIPWICAFIMSFMFLAWTMYCWLTALSQSILLICSSIIVHFLDCFC